MYKLLAQIILAQRHFDDEGWMNILFVIVVAVIWILGGVIKAMKAKTDNQQQKGHTPAHKPHDFIRGVQQQQSRVPAQQAHRSSGPARPARPFEQPSGVQKKSLTLADLREAARRFAAEAEQAFKEPPPKPKPTPRPPQQVEVTPKPQVYRKPTSEVMTTGVSFTKSSDKQDKFAKSPTPNQLSDLISDYDDPEKLRKAILNYEILGPPLSLRN